MTDFLNEHQRRKLLVGFRGGHPWEIFLIFTPLSPLSRVSESFRQDFNLGKCFLLLKYIYVMKNVTNFSKLHLKRRLCLQDDEHTESLKIESREYF